jgi:hypothetical protein
LEEMTMLNPKLSSETAREAAALTTGRIISPESIEKMRISRSNWKFPSKCVACSSRDVDMCMKFNKTAFQARETDCFRRYDRKVVHPDYKKVIK